MCYSAIVATVRVLYSVGSTVVVGREKGINDHRRSHGAGTGTVRKLISLLTFYRRFCLLRVCLRRCRDVCRAPSGDVGDRYRRTIARAYMLLLVAIYAHLRLQSTKSDEHAMLSCRLYTRSRHRPGSSR